MPVDYDGFSGGDRTRIELPAVQTAFLQALQAAGRPVVFVNCSGSAMAMPWEAGNLPAILQLGIQGRQAEPPWRACFSATATRRGGFLSRCTGRPLICRHLRTTRWPTAPTASSRASLSSIRSWAQLHPVSLRPNNVGPGKYRRGRRGDREAGADQYRRPRWDEVVEVYCHRAGAENPQLPGNASAAFNASASRKAKARPSHSHSRPARCGAGMRRPRPMWSTPVGTSFAQALRRPTSARPPRFTSRHKEAREWSAAPPPPSLPRTG